jgi:hypothetical protein
MLEEISCLVQPKHGASCILQSSGDRLDELGLSRKVYVVVVY